MSEDELEFLRESQLGWEASARHDRRQAMASFSIAGSGLFLVGAGFNELWHGDAGGGALMLSLGGLAAWGFGKLGIGELGDYAASVRTAARREEAASGN